MPNAIPPVTSADIFEQRAAQHGQVAHVDFGLWGLALGVDNLADIEGLFTAGAVAVKLFWGLRPAPSDPHPGLQPRR